MKHKRKAVLLSDDTVRGVQLGISDLMAKNVRIWTYVIAHRVQPMELGEITAAVLRPWAASR